jgi:hypothetical protein
MMTFVEREGLESIICWVDQGRAIKVNSPDHLIRVLPLFFSQTKYRSFERQLNGWKFDRILDGPFKGAYTHPYFLRGEFALCKMMSRNLDVGTLKKSVNSKGSPAMASKRRQNLANISCSPSMNIYQHESPINRDDCKDVMKDQEEYFQQAYECICDGDIVSFAGRCFHFVGSADQTEPTMMKPTSDIVYDEEEYQQSIEDFSW